MQRGHSGQLCERRKEEDEEDGRLSRPTHYVLHSSDLLMTMKVSADSDDSTTSLSQHGKTTYSSLLRHTVSSPQAHHAPLISFSSSRPKMFTPLPVPQHHTTP